jgi:hypothetical protein
MNASFRSLRAVALTAAALIVGNTVVLQSASAQEPSTQYKGYLGVYVVPTDGGMRIQRFIPDTPAEQLAQQGEIGKNHTIYKLGGMPTRSLTELRAARDRIPEGQEAKMLVRGPDGVYHVWISRNEGGYANQYYPAEGEKFGRPNPGSAAPPKGDYFYKGDVGEGNDQNFRPKGSGAEPKAGSPAPAAEGDFRPKK